MVHVLLVDVNVDMKGIHVVQVCDTDDYLNIYLLNLNIYTLFNRCDTNKLEDTRKLTRVRKSKKDRQHNGQKKKDRQHNTYYIVYHISFVSFWFRANSYLIWLLSHACLAEMKHIPTYSHWFDPSMARTHNVLY
jgi:hypothetical protein